MYRVYRRIIMKKTKNKKTKNKRKKKTYDVWCRIRIRIDCARVAETIRDHHTETMIKTTSRRCRHRRSIRDRRRAAAAARACAAAASGRHASRRSARVARGRNDSGNNYRRAVRR